MPDSPEQARAKLAQFVAELRELSFPTSPLSMDLVKFMAGGIEGYLEGKHRALDHALGLKRARGRPKPPPGKHLELAIDVTWRRIAGHSWQRICDDIDFNDPRELRRISERYYDAVIAHFAEQIGTRLHDKD